MTPIEKIEEKEQFLKEFKALKTIFGGLLLEGKREINPKDTAYYQRKFKEAQERLKR